MREIKLILCLISALLFFQIALLVYEINIQTSGHLIRSIKEITTEDHSIPAIRSIPNLPKTQIRFEKNNFDFGVIPDNKKVYTNFQFQNTGNEPLIILGAEGSCGCTVPKWPHESIAPGQYGSIEVSFDPNGKSGENSKIITITSNTDPQTTILTIKASIVKS